MAKDAEIFDLVDGHSLIDVRGSDFDSALLVGGQLIVLNWDDCGGTVAQYLARAGRTDCEQELQSLRQTLEGRWAGDTPISSRISPFLGLFVPGRYRLCYVEACPNCDYVEFDASWDHAQQHGGFYPSGQVLVFTQASDTLNPDRVAHYRASIRGGHRPIALTATVEGGWCDFVIDGHHKLLAYKCEGVRPTFVSVCRLDAPPLNSDPFDAYIGARHPLSGHYRSVKTTYDV